MNDMIWYYVIMILYDMVLMIVWHICVKVGYEWYNLETDCVKSFNSFLVNCQTAQQCSESFPDEYQIFIWYIIILFCY